MFYSLQISNVDRGTVLTSAEFLYFEELDSALTHMDKILKEYQTLDYDITPMNEIVSYTGTASIKRYYIKNKKTKERIIILVNCHAFMVPDKKFMVVGGEYTDTTFTHLVKDGVEVKEGPFDNYVKAKEVWASYSWKNVDNCHSRYHIVQC